MVKGRKRLLKDIDSVIRRARVPVYLHRFGPKTYTSWQHCKAWLLKERFKCSWQDFIDDHAPYYLDTIPDRSTLIKFVKRLPFWIKHALTIASVSLSHAEYGAIDSTGLSRTGASDHFVKRIDRKKPLKKPMKLSIYTAERNILSFRLRARWRGDTKDVPYLTRQSPFLADTNCLDRGYDANKVHSHFRSLGTYSIIPARANCRRGNYRKEMRDSFDHAQYWTRNQAEYVISAFKRRFGDRLRSRTFPTQHSEISAKIILHNLKALLVIFCGTFSPEPQRP